MLVQSANKACTLYRYRSPTMVWALKLLSNSVFTLWRHGNGRASKFILLYWYWRGVRTDIDDS